MEKVWIITIRLPLKADDALPCEAFNIQFCCVWFRSYTYYHISENTAGYATWASTWIPRQSSVKIHVSRTVSSCFNVLRQLRSI